MPEQYGYQDEYTPFGRALAALKIAKQEFMVTLPKPRYDELMPDDPAYGDSPLVAEGQFVPYPYQPMPYYPPTAEGVPYVPMPEPPWLSGGSSAIPMPLPPFVPSAEGVPVYPSSEEMVPYDQPQAPYVPWYDDYENEY